MAKEKKVTGVEYNQRIKTIAKLLFRFTTRADVLQYVSEKTDWNISERQVDNYISDAKKLLRKRTDLDVFVGQLINEFLDLYGRNLKIQDYREAKNLLIELAKLRGAYTDRVDITTKGESFNIKDLVSFEDKTK